MESWLRIIHLTKVGFSEFNVYQPLLKQKRRKEHCSVTVCVAAIAQWEGNSLVIGASDRMVTAGDIEFEQEQMKIHGLTSSIAIMVAGDLCTQMDILYEVEAWKNEQINEHPEVWLSVKRTADKFNESLIAARRKAARDAILAPLNMDYADLSSPNVSADLATQLSKEIYQFQFPSIEALVIGLDTLGAHVYLVDGVKGVCCHDWQGFAAIGYGAWHANSQMMFAGHTKHRGLAETVMLVYSAKKRAEVAPGVGEKTDMIAIGTGLGNSTTIGNPLMALLDDTFHTSQKQSENVRKDANEKITNFFQVPSGEASVQSQGTPELESGSPGETEDEEASAGGSTKADAIID